MPAQTSDVTTPIGQVRLLAFDTDLNVTIFDDDAYQVFLNLNNQNIRLAAAQAIDVIAGNESYVQKLIKMLDASTDGPAVAKDLRTYAAELRRQAYEGSGDFTGFVDVTEWVTDEFSARQRVLSQWLRLNQ